MRNKRLLLLTIMLIIMMSGCSNIKDANKDNFKNAAQQYLDTVYPACYFPVNLPFKKDSFTSGGILKILDMAVKNDLVKATESSGQQNSFLNSILYELTNKGEKYYRVNVYRDKYGQIFNGFCFGKATVNDIISFTDPYDHNGMKISAVTYTYKVSDIPEFARNSELFSLSPRLKGDVLSEEKPVNITHAFVLTDDGWVHESLVKK